MAQFALDSKDIMRGLIPLAKRLADAIGWVAQRPGKVKVEIPDDVWRHGGLSIRGTPDCDSLPRIMPKCLIEAVPEERAEVEILLAVLAKMGSKETRRPRTRRRK